MVDWVLKTTGHREGSEREKKKKNHKPPHRDLVSLAALSKTSLKSQKRLQTVQIWSSSEIRFNSMTKTKICEHSTHVLHASTKSN